MKFTVRRPSRMRFKGSRDSELRMFIQNPLPIEVVITDLSEKDHITTIMPKLTNAVQHQLNILTWTDASQLTIVSISKNSKTRGRAVILLGQHAWEEAFGQIASDRWRQARARRDKQKQVLAASRLAFRKRQRLARRDKLNAIKSSKRISNSTSVGDFKNVLVHVVRIGGQLRVRAVNSDSRVNHRFNISFPRELRQSGARYVVEELVDAGKFYRARGKILWVV